MPDLIQVDSYGRCFRNISIKAKTPMSPKKRPPQKYRILTQYKFVLAFENTQEWDYVSEKVYHARVTGTLPVY
jgi:alpha-1,3-fucosyltransferase 10